MYIKNLITKYESRQWNKGGAYNRIKRLLQKKSPEAHMFVPRDDIWMHNDLPVQAHEPELIDIRLGSAFIDYCNVTGVDWTQFTLRFVSTDRNVDPDTLRELWDMAQSDCDQYELKNGLVDGAWNPIAKRYMPRKPRIGDEVQIWSNPPTSGCGLRNGEPHAYLDGTENHQEPVEYRSDVPADDVAYTSERYDGDARWQAMSALDELFIYSPPERINRVMSRGAWITPGQAESVGLGVSEYARDWKAIRTTHGRQWLIWIDATDYWDRHLRHREPAYTPTPEHHKSHVDVWKKKKNEDAWHLLRNS